MPGASLAVVPKASREAKPAAIPRRAKRRPLQSVRPSGRRRSVAARPPGGAPEKSLSAAAKAAKIAPERLRHYASQRDIIERKGRRWSVRPELPRRMLLFSEGKALQVTVGDFDSASKIGRFMSAVSQFLRTNNPGGLREFEGMSVIDVSGKTHVFETCPNSPYRLASAYDQSFEHIYRIVV